MSVELAIGLAVFGVAVGASSGLLGIGGGALMVPFLVLVGDYGQHTAEAISLLVMLPTAIVGSVVLRRRGIGDLRRALTLGAFGAAGGFAGARLAVALPADTLRLLFAVFLAVIGVDMVRRARPAARAD
jgi:uncharacterized membrane protein YfcA